MSHTYAILEVSPVAYADIRARLDASGYGQAFHQDDEHGEVIDMHGIALAVDDSHKPYQQRVIDERESLQEKVEKLALFVNSPACLDLANAERVRLDRQLRLMREYSAVLAERIEQWK